MKFCQFCLPKINEEKAKVIIIGIPFEGKVNSRQGSKLAPEAIRRLSDCIESYSPFLDRDLKEIAFYDAGDILIEAMPSELIVAEIKSRLMDKLIPGKRYTFLGGDHTITLPIVQTLIQWHPQLYILHIDAHPDLLSSFQGERYCYATVMHRISEIIPSQRIYQVGMRTGEKEEFKFARTNTNLFPLDTIAFSQTVKFISQKLSGKKVYVTIDIDALDPSLVPGTSNPEIGGLLYPQLRELITSLKTSDIIGLDLVEVSPPLDPTGLTPIVASQIIRDCILSWWG